MNTKSHSLLGQEGSHKNKSVSVIPFYAQITDMERNGATQIKPRSTSLARPLETLNHFVSLHRFLRAPTEKHFIKGPSILKKETTPFVLIYKFTLIDHTHTLLA